MITKRMVLIPVRDAGIGVASGFIAKMIQNNEVKTYLGIKPSGWFTLGELFTGLGLFYLGKGKYEGISSAIIASSAAVGGMLIANPVLGKFHALQRKLVRYGGGSSNNETIIPIGAESDDK